MLSAGDGENAEAVTGDLEAVECGDVDAVELYGGVEAVGERGDDSLAENGFCVVGDVLESDDEGKCGEQTEAREPQKPASAPPRTGWPVIGFTIVHEQGWALPGGSMQRYCVA